MTTKFRERNAAMSTRPQRPLLEVDDRAELRAWLSAHHADSPGVRLAIGNKGSTTTALTYEDAVLEALAFGWIDSTSGRLDAQRHTVLFVPRKRGGTWARTNKARVERLIAEGLMTDAGLEAIERAKADGSWTALDEVEAMIVPPDLAAALAAEPTADRAFSSRTASQRKLALSWIASAKREETRSRRISEVVRAAAEERPLR
jgi:uncharacterized protein YdeI (YjbR/CyaY-like superfamily)